MSLHSLEFFPCRSDKKIVCHFNTGILGECVDASRDSAKPKVASLLRPTTWRRSVCGECRLPKVQDSLPLEGQRGECRLPKAQDFGGQVR